jgi:multicomponent Na+:H+ antiporter subunit E
MDKKVLLFNTTILSLLYGVIWLILSGGRVDLFALFFILVLGIITPLIFDVKFKKLNFNACFRLFGFFIINSIKSGILVSRLALKPNLKLSPLVYNLPLKTQTPFATSMLANIYSLMPGTLSMGISNNILILHILDTTLFDKPFIDIVQDRIIEVFEDGGNHDI